MASLRQLHSSGLPGQATCYRVCRHNMRPIHYRAPIRRAAAAVSAEAAKAPVQFSVQKTVGFGDTIKLIGSAPELGAWDTEAALQLDWADGDVWSVTRELSPGEYGFKVIISRADGGVDWEEGDNRVVTVPEDADPSTVIAAVLSFGDTSQTSVVAASVEEDAAPAADAAPAEEDPLAPAEAAAAEPAGPPATAELQPAAAEAALGSASGLLEGAAAAEAAKQLEAVAELASGLATSPPASEASPAKADTPSQSVPTPEDSPAFQDSPGANPVAVFVTLLILVAPAVAWWWKNK